MPKNKPQLNPAIVFVIKFLGLFALLYGFYIIYLSLTAPGGLYSPFLDKHLNFIAWLRYVLIESSSATLQLLGYQTKTNITQMLVVKHNIINVGYDCLGFGVMTFFTAFVIAYPGVLKAKLYFFFVGIISIQLLNLVRFMLLALYWKHSNVYITDHHTIFNLIAYLLIAVSIYFYTRYQDKYFKLHAAN
ncbi:exosortase Y [Mucilaginibacter sp.]|jgi:exosortase/archaeosortase family protein|uniref:exosortase Y n=1 Tax=Mucilaginibacter sp. TaxID=1882438 RepID=UPI003565A4CF